MLVQIQILYIKDYTWIYDDDNGAAGEPSQSGTFVRPVRGGEVIDVRKEGNRGVRLRDGDTFFFVGKVYGEEVDYWEFTLRETQTTRANNFNSSATIYEPDIIAYSFGLKSLVKGTDQEIVKLRPLVRKLITYMAQQNQVNNGKPKLCTYDELIKAVARKLIRYV